MRFQCCERNYAVLSGDIHTVLSVDIYAVLSDNPCSMRRAKSPKLRVLSEAIYGENGTSLGLVWLVGPVGPQNGLKPPLQEFVPKLSSPDNV